MIKFKQVLAAACAAAAIAAASAPATADTLYDNGPIDGTVDAFTVNNNFAISNSFVLSAPATLTGVEIGMWGNQDTPFTSIDWGITTTPNSFPINGTASVTKGAVTGTIWGYDLFNATFSLPNLTLGAGTYYLVLQNANAGGNAIYWDENNGPSTAYSNWNGDLANYERQGTNSESFRIFGTNGAVPEPATWGMMIAGFAIAGAAMRRRAARVAFAA